MLSNKETKEIIFSPLVKIVGQIRLSGFGKTTYLWRELLWIFKNRYSMLICLKETIIDHAFKINWPKIEAV